MCFPSLYVTFSCPFAFLAGRCHSWPGQSALMPTAIAQQARQLLKATETDFLIVSQSALRLSCCSAVFHQHCPHLTHLPVTLPHQGDCCYLVPQTALNIQSRQYIHNLGPVTHGQIVRPNATLSSIHLQMDFLVLMELSSDHLSLSKPPQMLLSPIPEFRLCTPAVYLLLLH